jgi:hypothetical protein
VRSLIGTKSAPGKLYNKSYTGVLRTRQRKEKEYCKVKCRMVPVTMEADEDPLCDFRLRKATYDRVLENSVVGGERGSHKLEQVAQCVQPSEQHQNGNSRLI